MVTEQLLNHISRTTETSLNFQALITVIQATWFVAWIAWIYFRRK